MDTDIDVLRARAETILRGLAGEDATLRVDQWTAIEALVVHRRRALVVQRTGWGKSAVYFVATGLLREAGAGPTVIVSPLLALMRNQIEAARRAGIAAVTINSANQHEWDEVEASIADGDVDVLLVSPERLNNPDFRDTVLPKLAATAGMLVVDEAHCISDWGHDFRPDYRRLRSLIAELPDGVPVLATTATANDRVVADVAEQLLPGGQPAVEPFAPPAGGGHPPSHQPTKPPPEGGPRIPESPPPQITAPDPDHHNPPGERTRARMQLGSASGAVVLRGALDRESLHLAVVSLPTEEERLAWLAQRLDELTGSGIIYTLTVAAANDIAAFLTERGHPVAAYTGKSEPSERLQAEQDLLDNKVKALVATSALGMGFDKPDLGFVIHVGAPSSPIAYYQQVGRAGRGVRRADVILLPGPEDRAIWDYFTSMAFPDEQQVQQVLNALAWQSKPLSTAALEPQVELSRTRLELVLKVLDVDGAVRRVRGGWEATGSQWRYDTERYQRVAQARRAEQQAMLRYASATDCRMEFLLSQLDDPHAAACGRCDNCTGRHWDATVPAESLADAAARLNRPGIEVAPRRQWPTGLKSVGLDLSGRIPEDERAEPGRALGRLTDVGWGTRLRDLLGAGKPDGPVPQQVFLACVKVLAAWDWPERPVAVVGIGSATRPRLASDLADRIATTGRLRLLGFLEAHGPSPRRSNSAQRVAALDERLRVPADLAAELSTVSGPVMLVDDLTDTGWTLTMAARLLRNAGAPAVLPFTLAATA